MTVELAQAVSRRLESDRYVWLTTVAKSGQPVPRLVWFFFDGKEVTVYSMPKAAKIVHIKARPQVSLNLDSDGNGRGTVVVAGAARVDAVGADSLADEQYQAKYHDYAVSIGMGDEYLAAFSTRLKISVDKVWSTPSAGQPLYPAVMLEIGEADALAGLLDEVEDVAVDTTAWA